MTNEPIDIENLSNLQKVVYKEEEEKDLLDMNNINEPISTSQQVSEELGRNLSENFDSNPTEEELFENKKGIVKYPLLLLDNVYCPEILNSIVKKIDDITYDINSEGKMINVYYSDGLGNVRLIGLKKINPEVFIYAKSFLCEFKYYESKGNIVEIQYEDFIDFQRLKPKIVIEDENITTYKDKTNPLRQLNIPEEIQKDPISFQLEMMKRLQKRDVLEENNNTDIEKSAIDEFLPPPIPSSIEQDKPKEDNDTTQSNKSKQDLDAIDFG